ncbi:hypothetical protein RUR49_14940, partial [Pseudoxanthobacter sp. M-2]|uniref:hypothetical protein n=1 Tax=Pseudoxanthobacter sp. M-2 TaxID=3078754 RepID=UPI0038FC6BE4
EAPDYNPLTNEGGAAAGGERLRPRASLNRRELTAWGNPGGGFVGSGDGFRHLGAAFFEN